MSRYPIKTNLDEHIFYHDKNYVLVVGCIFCQNEINHIKAYIKQEKPLNKEELLEMKKNVN